MGKLFDELKHLKEEYDRKLQEGGEEALKDAFKDVFAKFPEVESIYWDQYTPYFNDGDPCYFRVYDFDCSLFVPKDLDTRIENKERELESASDDTSAKIQEELDQLTDLRNFCEEEYSYGESLYVLKSTTIPRTKEIIDAIRELEREIPNDVLESVFGDHVSVTATREGFSVCEKHHD